ncbi:MAG: SPOR domain-containing protein [Candidatus Zixiibacteriota bacterium]|nr:MAG: SPOR domain-containing protein [candidate division Zixibacteria bacterium]
MVKIVLALCLVILVAETSPASEILELINKGRLTEARGKIAEEATAARREGSLLYYQALLEPDGNKSIQFLKAAFKAEISPRHLEDNIYRMALYYQADGSFEKLATTALAYLQYWENGRYRPEIIRLHSLAARQIGEIDQSEKYLKNLIEENPDNRYGDIGRLDKAVNHYRRKEYIKAQNICRKLANGKHDDAVTPALFMLSFHAMEQKRVDDAILYYNILKEGYPNAVGLDDLVDMFSGMERAAADNSAERITGTVYSVQAGVFSVKDNAERLQDRLKEYGQPVEIKSRTISDKEYYVVYVGRFVSSDEAMVFKARLESLEKEVYQIVAR